MPPSSRADLAPYPASAPSSSGTAAKWRNDLAGLAELDRPVGSSAAYHAALHKILHVASTNATVLLLGESGMGKTIFAHEVRANGPFVAINCAAIPEALIESELFYVQRGPVRLTDIEEVYIEVAMELSEGNVSKAAGMLGYTRAQLDYRLKKMAQGEG